MSEAKTTAVIVTYNSRAVIEQALEEARHAHDAGRLDVIIVDNASADGSAQFVRERFPWVRVVDAGGNLGFGRGCNRGLDDVVTPNVLFLNPDAQLPIDALETLERFLAAHPSAAIVGPATWTYGGTQLQAAGGLPTPWDIVIAAAGGRPHPKGRQTINPGSAPFKTDWLGGGIMLARADDIRRLGGFDPRFFLYFEETDLCRRAIDAGYELWAVGTATATHIGGTAAKSSGQTLVYGASIADPYFRSRFYYLVKHFGWPAAVFAEGSEIVLLAAKSLVKKLLGREGDELAHRLGGPVMRQPAPVMATDLRSKAR